MCLHGGGHHDHACTCLQVLDEIGVDLATAMQSAPAKRVAAKQPAAAEADAEDELADDLVARLANLKS